MSLLLCKFCYEWTDWDFEPRMRVLLCQFKRLRRSTILRKSIHLVRLAGFEPAMGYYPTVYLRVIWLRKDRHSRPLSDKRIYFCRSGGSWNLINRFGDDYSAFKLHSYFAYPNGFEPLTTLTLYRVGTDWSRHWADTYLLWWLPVTIWVGSGFNRLHYLVCLVTL